MGSHSPAFQWKPKYQHDDERRGDHPQQPKRQHELCRTPDIECADKHGQRGEQAAKCKRSAHCDQGRHQPMKRSTVVLQSGHSGRRCRVDGCARSK
jgi:hypothetical protein